jgi:hypothetical protein
MRYVSSIPPVSASSNARQVRALSAVQAVKPVHIPVRIVPYVETSMVHQGAVPIVEQQKKPNIPIENRRKISRRVNRQAVLVEFRSGIDRRHQNLRESGTAEHIDEIA